MFIHVTQKHIEKGTLRNAQWCPIAWAICDSLKVSHQDVSVTKRHITVRGTTHTSPVRVQRFIKAFDSSARGKPFAFILCS